MNKNQIITVIISLIIGFAVGKIIFSGSSDKTDKHQNETKEEHWTCSMHPEIDMPEFGQCPKCGMDLIPKEVGNDDVAINSFKMTKNAMALANIETLVIGKSIDKTQDGNLLNLSGKIITNDKASAIQTAHFGGRLERLLFKSKGEYIKKGALLATVYSPELVTAQNEFLEALYIKNEQPELYKAVRNKLKNWKISENQINKIERDKKVITNFNMYANVSGYIDEVLVQEGNHIKEGSPLFKVSNLGSVWASFDVYEQDIKILKIGQDIIITSNAYPNEKIKTKINFINPNLNVATRTVQVRATVKNSGTKLKPGMLLTGKIAVNTKLNNDKKKIINIPKTAVMWTGKRSIVYVKTIKDEPIFELREVTLSNSTGKNYQVIEGLSNGEEIVVNGTFTVDAAAQLQGKSSMMNVKKKQDERGKTKDNKHIVKRIEVNTKFKEQLYIIFQDYLKIKNALVISDTRKVGYNSEVMLKELKKIKMSLLKKPEAHEVWMPASKTMKTVLQKISTETDIEKQRSEFISLSNAIITVISSFGVGEQEVYVEHCPMANNNQGADWLSLEKAIKNPYFGDKMLQCGSVKQTIK